MKEVCSIKERDEVSRELGRRALSNQAFPEDLGHGAGAGVDVQFRVYVAQVSIDGVIADGQVVGDFLH